MLACVLGGCACVSVHVCLFGMCVRVPAGVCVCERVQALVRYVDCGH